MNRILADPIVEFGGLAFLDDSFNARRQLAAIAAVRYAKGRELEVGGHIARVEIEHWLAPAHAVQLHPDAAPIRAQPLGPARQAKVGQAIAEMITVMPEWEQLLNLPLRFALLSPPTGAVSASRRMWPQHVLLGEQVFYSSDILGEQVVHETAHQWFYLLLDLWAVQVQEVTEHALPSGTAGRQPWEVLGAAHVALALARLHDRLPDQPGRAGRLRTYAFGCLDILARSLELTDAGERIAHRLKEEL